jgi:two-component system chemotaxis response regulator CheY
MTYDPNSIKILIADDHFLLRQVLTNVMREKGINNIDTAADGKIARDMVEHAYSEGSPYDVVFLDWEMPIIAGIDVLKHFRDHPQFERTAFVMVTAVSTQAQVLDAIKSGASAYLTKPLSSEAVHKKFDEIIARIVTRKQ